MTGESLETRFVAAVTKLIPEFDDGDQKLGLAVSGGPDSLALLLLAASAFPRKIAAATVDHQLRPEAKAEAEHVAKICVERDIPHQTLTPTIPIRGSVQAEARKTRYSLLHGWMEREKIDWLATAHHADDQLETMIMRILRGSGLDGLSAIRAKYGQIIRPLLHFPQQELLSHIDEQDVTAIDDPSNHDTSFDRVRVRNALKKLEGFDSSLASQSAAILDDTRKAVGWMINGLASKHICETDNGCTLDAHDFPKEIVWRLLLRCLHICDPALSPRGDQIGRTIKALKSGETTTIGDILCKGGEIWSFSAAPERQN